MATRLAAAGAEEAVLGLSEIVQAGGGVVVRRIDGRAEIVLVHRARYDDWSIPKGKLMDGETHLEAALREVSEETGIECRPGIELPSSTYELGDGSRKIVRYWAMEPTSETTLHPTEEIDRASWLAVAEATRRLTHDRDRAVLAAVAARSEPAYLIRHAKAGSREAWNDRDELRPLSKSGRRQAKAIVHAFDGRGVGRIISSPAVRCVETVRPLAAARSRDIEAREELAEGQPFDGARALLQTIAATPVVLCGHGDLLPALVRDAESAGAIVVGGRGWKKASIWILEREAGVVVRMRYVPPPEFDDRSSTGDRSPDRKRHVSERGPDRGAG